jgi:hypothetical protein
MNIKTAKYIQVDGENAGIYVVTNDDRCISVPIDPANRHYAAILKWAEEDGNTIQEAD